jgi:hypothetical protein
MDHERGLLMDGTPGQFEDNQSIAAAPNSARTSSSVRPVRFLIRVKELLEDPENLLLEG